MNYDVESDNEEKRNLCGFSHQYITEMKRRLTDPATKQFCKQKDN